MSSSSVCQGLQSCLEPRLVEPRVLKLRLAPPPTKLKSSNSSKPFVSNFDPLEESQNELKNTSSSNKLDANNGGWSFLQALSNTSESGKTEKVYVHPLVKRSSSLLSKESLEMCTESLGSETGSDVSESSYNSEIALLSVENEKFPTTTTRQSSRLREVWSPPPPKKRLNRSTSFPPPLTSISGSVGLQVRPHREEGRLVLEAVTVSSCRTYFHAERADGRLRLRLVNNFPPNYDNDDAENQEVEEEEEEKEEEMGMSIGADEEQVVEAEGVDENESAENENNEVCHGEEEEEEEIGEGCWGEMEGNSGNVRGEMGMEKLSRPSRCKDGGCGKKRLMNWEPFCVAT
ncbi:hypothetical protein FNV43_RR23396 [Rhamnella rubrinervis]|uniref:FAF domain-containing protein n=1 Tax=Rhamnella rubrinervis TaxID=2594499 RepID=A0A8K0DY08_9ROSA|nr:hypothetical protein FNV43_RR23396 [Rhamnella rubrinervis]